jgi:hypothetical protein
VAASRRHPNGHGSTQLIHRSPDFQRFVDYGITHTSLDRRGMPPVTAMMRRVGADVEVAVVSRTTATKQRKARPSLMLER